MKLRMIVCMALIAVLAACGGAEERKAVYLEKAKASIESGDLEKARIELKNVLQIDPKDSEARYQLGRVYEQQKDYNKAFSQFLGVEELDPSNLTNQAKLGSFYLLLANDNDKAQEKIDLILAKDPEHAEGLLLKSAMMLKNKNHDEALKIAKSVMSRSPGHVDGAIYLASLYVNDKNNSEAINTLENALAVNPGNEKLNNIYARVLISNKEFDRAEVIYKDFLEKNPDNSSSYNNLAAFYHAADNKEKAEETLRASVDNDPSDVDRQINLVKYIKAVKGDDEAIIELKNLIAKNNGLGKLRTALGELLYVKGDKNAAIVVYENAIKDFPEEVTGVESRIALAAIYFNDKEFASASKIINEAILISPNDPKINLLKAKLAINEKDTEQAILALRVVTKEAPDNIEAFLLLANAYQSEGNTDQVRSALNSAYENNRTNPEALLKLVQIQLSRDIDVAEKIIDDYNVIKESDYDGLSIKAAILNQKKSYDDAYKISNRLIELFPDKPAGYMQAIPYHSQHGDKQNAISLLEKGYINVKDNRKLLVLLTTLQVSDNKFDIVEQRIKSELSSTPGDVELKLLLSKVYIAKNDKKAAESLLKEVVDSNKSDVEEPYLLLAQLYQKDKDMESVKSILNQGMNNVTSSIKIPISLATAYEISKDYDNATKVYRELYKKYPDNLIIVNNLASMLSDHSDNAADMSLTKILAEKLEKSDQPAFLDTVGWVYYKHSDYETAIQYLRKVVEKMPDVNVFNYHLGMAYKMAGDKAQAKTYLEKSLTDGKEFTQKNLAEAALKDL